MRLFIGILFPEEVLDQIMEVSSRLKAISTKGNFTYRENLHLTLVFLGEVDPHRIEDIQACMEGIKWAPFTLELDGLGRFPRKDGDIYWIGIRKSQDLLQLQNSLSHSLQQGGFAMEDRPYKPHLTLGRRVRVPNHFDMDALSQEVPQIKVEVDGIHLMQSHRVEGRLTYSPLKMVAANLK